METGTVIKKGVDEFGNNYIKIRPNDGTQDFYVFETLNGVEKQDIPCLEISKLL